MSFFALDKGAGQVGYIAQVLVAPFDIKIGRAASARTRVMGLRAGMVGTAQPTISRILNGKRRPSPSMAREIERITGGKVRRHELRPDLWDAPKRRAAA